MGYYTSFELRVVPELTDEMGEYIENNPEDKFYAIDGDGNTNDSCKWYDHDDDMEEFSAKFPGSLFILSGNGEENGDMWRSYYINGKKVKHVKAQIVFEEVDEQELLKKYAE